MSQLSNCNLNKVGHETINLINNFSHQILNNVCEFVQPVVQHINPHINITNTNEYVNKYIDLDRNETNDFIMLIGNVPGITKNSLDISLNNTKLIISAKTDMSQLSTDDFDWSYFKNIHYYRTFNVSSDTTSEDINVKYSDGLLRIVINKHSEPEPQSQSINIEIK